MTDELWKHLDTVAQLVSAIGTFAAVLVALYLARHQNRNRLRVTAGRGTIVEAHVAGGSEQVFRISVTNSGYRDLVIEGIGWRVGFARKTHFYQTLSSHILAGKLPWKLMPSERATFVFLWDNYLATSGKLRSALGKYSLARRWRARTLRVQVFLSTGETLSFRVSKDLRDTIRTGEIGAGAS